MPSHDDPNPETMHELIREQLAGRVPFARHLGLQVQALDGRGACVRAVPAPHLMNHVGTLHAGLLFAACEAATGAALAGALAPLILRTRFVVRDARIAFLKPASGELTATAALVDEGARLLDELQHLGRVDALVDVTARTPGPSASPHDALVVARASFTWHLRLDAA